MWNVIFTIVNSTESKYSYTNYLGASLIFLLSQIICYFDFYLEGMNVFRTFKCIVENYVWILKKTVTCYFLKRSQAPHNYVKSSWQVKYFY